MKYFVIFFLVFITNFSYGQSLSYMRSDTTNSGVFNEYFSIIIPPKNEDKAVMSYVNSNSVDVTHVNILKDTTVNKYDASIVSFGLSKQKKLVVATPDGLHIFLIANHDKQIKRFDMVTYNVPSIMQPSSNSVTLNDVINVARFLAPFLL